MASVYYNQDDQVAAQILASKTGLSAIPAPTSKPVLTGSILVGGPLAPNSPPWWTKEFPPLSVKDDNLLSPFPLHHSALYVFPKETDSPSLFDVAVTAVYAYNTVADMQQLLQRSGNYYNIAAVDDPNLASEISIAQKAQQAGFNAIELDEVQISLSNYTSLKANLNIPVGVTTGNSMPYLAQALNEILPDFLYLELYWNNWKAYLDYANGIWKTSTPLFTVLNIADPNMATSDPALFPTVLSYALQNSNSVWIWGQNTGNATLQVRADQNWPNVKLLLSGWRQGLTWDKQWRILDNRYGICPLYTSTKPNNDGATLVFGTTSCNTLTATKQFS